MSTNFPGSPHMMGFVAFSCPMGNWWGNPCFFHMIKYTIGQESYAEKSPIIWEKYEHQFPRFTSYDGFCCIFSYYEKLMEKPMHPHTMKYTIGLKSNVKKSPILWEKYEYQFPRLSPYHGFCCILAYCRKFMGKPMHFPRV